MRGEVTVTDGGEEFVLIVVEIQRDLQVARGCELRELRRDDRLAQSGGGLVSGEVKGIRCAHPLTRLRRPLPQGEAKKPEEALFSLREKVARAKLETDEGASHAS